MNILVTGATGLVGSHLCRKLISEGHYVVGLTHSRINPLIDSLLKFPNFKVCGGDIGWKDTVLSIVKNNNIKTIFHTAATMPYSPEKNFIGINVCGTLNLLEAAQLSRVKEFVYASSMSIYSEPPEYLPVDEQHPAQPPTIYGITKLAGELSCKSYQEFMAIILLRYAGIYGIGMDETRAIPKFIGCALRGQPIAIFGKGEQSNDFTYVEDAVEGTYLAWNKKESNTYNISSGQETSIISLAQKIIELTNSKSQIAFSDGKVDRPFRFVLDITKAKKKLGYTPHNVSNGLGMYIKSTSNGEGKG
jgi:UDP-glucose 4-epimerase